MAISRGMFANYSTGYNFVNPNLIALEEMLDAVDVQRIRKYVTCWDFYDGFHWQQIEPSDKPEITQNWCRRFVNKFVASEFNEGFSFKFDADVEDKVLPFLDEVWDDNRKNALIQELGQLKGVTGDAYIQVHYEPKFINGVRNPDFLDPFDEYEKGRIRLYLVPSSICFPRYKDGYDTNEMESCTIVFPVREEPSSLFGATQASRFTIMKYVYYNDFIEVYKGKQLLSRDPNPYGIIPIVHFKNLSLAGRYFGLSDLEDIIPINTEINLKCSDTSEILDYHSAPITIVKGARVSQLEKGANKVWGGLPKDADVFNLELKSDLQAASDYRNYLKTTMHEVGGIPKFALGGEDIPTNLSGIALQIAFMPLLDVVKTKRNLTAESFKRVNKLVIKIGLQEGLLEGLQDVKPKLIYKHDIVFGDILPKDVIQELEQLQQEFKLGLTTQEEAMKRLKKENIQELMKEVESERKEKPLVYGVEPVLVAAGNKLVNPETGDEVFSNDKDVENLEMQGDQQLELADKNAKTQQVIAKQTAQNQVKGQMQNKPVGKNKEGNDAKINSGLTNKNPGKNQ